MRLISNSFPDEVWCRLKTWAHEQALARASPSRDECAACVQRLAEEISGRKEALRPDVVQFYAAEAADMIAKFRDQVWASSGGVGGMEPEAAI